MAEQTNQRPYRLGLDLGSNSVGWFVTYLEKRGDRYEPSALGPGGVRIFPTAAIPRARCRMRWIAAWHAARASAGIASCSGAKS